MSEYSKFCPIGLSDPCFGWLGIAGKRASLQWCIFVIFEGSIAINHLGILASNNFFPVRSARLREREREREVDS